MSAMRSVAPARSAGGRFGGALTWRSHVKAAPAAGAYQNRQLMRGGRA
jgi:hypothetical protein